MDVEEEDWWTDFAASAPTDAELRAHLDSCRGEQGAELRRIIQDNLVLRWSARILLEHMRMTSGMTAGATEENSAMKIALFMIERRRPD